MENEYLNCPFCGSKAALSYTEVYILCENETCWFYSNYVPVRTWQSRPIEIKLSAEIVALRNLLEEYKKG